MVSEYVQAETITGSLFEIQIATKLPLDDWANEEVEDPEPYAQWDPTCYKFFEFTNSTGNEIGKRLVGCHSSSGADGNTQLKIYLAISPDKLISEKQALCLREAYKKAFDDWKAAMSASFQIRPEQIQFSSIFKRVKLNAQMISGTVNEGSPEVQPYEGVPDYEFRLKVKKFLLPWMRSINAQFPLISISPRWKVDSDSQLSVKIWFDVTGKSDEMQYGLFSDHMNAMTKSSQGPFKLAEVLEEG
ncbi:hypothetical protein D915_004649 [Fasciola hepatica]|uniref:Uncharacterized protein n=1 Tax=Fasciola hepatica TaxID=6192 RepID=A0A4E0REP1_FASHE|nr:hypothetical protein D915_004649 [Fasciola hepatica]